MKADDAIKILEKEWEKSVGDYRFQNPQKLEREDALDMAIEALRAVQEARKADRANISEIMENMEITQDIATSICPNMWHSGNKQMANGECDRFICRYHMKKYNRHDETLMIIPYTNNELADALKKHCYYYFEEERETCPGRTWIEKDTQEGGTKDA